MNRFERWSQLFWFAGGAFCGLIALSISKAALPPSAVTDDTAIYQNLSEIQVSKERTPNFDADLEKLSRIENQYRDKLPGVMAGRSSYLGQSKTAASKNPVQNTLR